MAERWDDLLALYDRTIASASDQAAKILLLEEASQTARDLANKPDKAIEYLQALQPLRPGDDKLAQSLERLLEKHERWSDLIELWQSRLGDLGEAEKLATRSRIASCFLDNLGDPGQALEAAREFLNESSDDSEPCSLLERIVAFQASPHAVRDGALDLLRYRYETTDRPREIVRVLEGAIDVDPERALEFRQEAAQRLAELGDIDAAMQHYSALLAMTPSSAANLGHLRQLAQRSGNHAAFASGVEGAAAASTDPQRRVFLLSTAAKTKQEELDDTDGAIALYQSALSVEEIESQDVLTVGRRLNALLTEANRPAERLAVIERLAAAESVPSNRRAFIGDIARLAEGLGDAQRAISAWRARLELDGNDRIALDGMITLLARESQWQDLIDALRRRIELSTSPAEKRADLVQIARAYQRELGDVDNALTAWTQVQEQFGESDETADALAELLSSAERWSDLSSLLERASQRQSQRLVERMIVLGQAYQNHLDAPGRALECYDRILRIDPYHEEAREGLHGLSKEDSCAARAIDILAETYRATDDWKGALSLTEARVSQATDLETKLHLLKDAAKIHRTRAEDAGAALTLLARALPMAPADHLLQQDVFDLARETESWDAAIGALEQARAAVESDPAARSDLAIKLARAYEQGKDDIPKALEHYETYAELNRDKLEAAENVVKHAATLGRWPTVVGAVTGFVAERGRVPDDLMGNIAEHAEQANAWSEVANALAESVSTTELDDRSKAELWWTIALWQRDKASNSAAAAAALEHAISAEPNRVAAIQALAELQRETPGPELFATIQKLADLEPNQLDLHRELAELALAHVSDDAVVDGALANLFARASAAFKGTAASTSTMPTGEVTTWVLEQSCERFLTSERPAMAYAALVEAARLPYDAAAQRSLRVRAAAIAGERLGDPDGAIEMYRGILSQAPEDSEALEKLGDLLKQENRTAELLSLCQHELGLSPDPERRLALRLELARLVGEIEEKGGRLEALHQNLEESPGHAATIENLASVLEGRRQYEDLHQLFVTQAERLEENSEVERSADLWARAAATADEKLGDLKRAIEGHRRTAALKPNAATFNALATLYLGRDEPGQAIPWLDRLLQATESEGRESVVLRLSTAHQAAGDSKQAAEVLRQAVTHIGNLPQLRSVLADLYRESENWEALAELLTQSLEVAEDQSVAVEYAREAADIYHSRLGNPGAAIPALRKALEAAPEDRGMRIMLATGLRQAGELAEAREILETLVAEFGRRRSKERAGIHVELALLAQAEGNHEESLKAIELASSMDVGNPKLLRKTSELALASGDLDKAEKSLRALLLVVRRQPPGDDLEAVGESEVLFELHAIAKQRGDDEQQKELLESALEASAQSDSEVRRLRRTLLSHGEHDILLRALTTRLDATDAPKSKSLLLSDLAAVLEDKGEGREALERRLDALSLDPGRLDLHASTQARAIELGEIEAYTTRVLEMIGGLRRDDEKALPAALLMQLGSLAEEHGGDLGRAQEFFLQAEEIGHNRADALFALARVAGARGDDEVSQRALGELTEMATGQEPSPAQATALYRLAAMQVKHDTQRANGIEMLTRGLEVDSRPAEAAAILRVAVEAEPDNRAVLALYERVARQSGEWQILLDFLERRAQLSDATPDQVREAVDLAAANDQHARGEALLQRAVDAARASEEGLAAAVWAVTALAKQKSQTDDLASARDLLFEAASIASHEELHSLGLSIAQRGMNDDKDLELAAQVLEFLRGMSPHSRDVWEPLVDIYRRSGQRDNLLEVVNATLPTLVEVGDRNALRLQNARFLIDSGEAETAIDTLRDALLDNADDLEAAAMLETVLRDTGDNEQLSDFLWQRFEDAKERREADTMTDVAMRLGKLLADMGSEETITVYRSALEVAPNSPAIIEAVIGTLPPEEERERAELFERLLAVCEEERVAELTEILADMWTKLDDYEGILRALRAGHDRAPQAPSIGSRLESFYRDAGMWSDLAQMMTKEGDSLEGEPAVARFREAAAVYREQLENPTAAAMVLNKARVADPSSSALVVELVHCLTSAGDLAGAAQAAQDALSDDLEGRARLEPLVAASVALRGLGRYAEAAAALEECFQLDPEQGADKLLIVLNEYRQASAGEGDRDGERNATLRLATLLAEGGHGEEASDLLINWVVAEPSDGEALNQLRVLDTAGQRWHGVVTACARLVMVESDEAQVAAGIELAQAAQAMGDIGQARQGLEYVNQVQPQNKEVRDHLQAIYTELGALRELAGLLLVGAEHSDDDNHKYDNYRQAADILVNQLGDAEGAIGPAQKAQELKPDDHETVVLFADVLTASGRAHEAAVMLEPAIAGHKRRSPELASLQYRMAKIAAATGDQDSQLVWLKKAFDVDRKNGIIAAELAQLATQLQDYDLALKPLRAISLMDTPGPISRVMALLWEAKIEHARGNRAKAELWAKKALREDPDFSEAHEFLSEIAE